MQIGSEQSANQNPQAVFSCPHDGCIRVFLKAGNLEKHMTSEKCTRALEKHSLMDLAKMGYKQELEEGVGIVPTLRAIPGNHSTIDVPTVNEGWALRSARKAYRFNETQTSYLTAKFQIGQTTGMKVNAEAVAVEMRRARDENGEKLFKVSEFLSTQQIASYFSRLAAKIRKQTLLEPDIRAIQEEENFAAATKSANEAINLQHPIVYDHYNVCAMNENNSLKNLKVGMLQLMCTTLGLQVPDPPIRRKAPYLQLLKDAFENCSCQKGD